MVVLLLLSAIALRALFVGRACYKKSGSYMCVGFFTMMLSHIVINIGMNISVLPVIGITLPFISAGGSSVLATYITMGLVHAVRMSQKRYIFD
jgi:rod shape determining protein RodA